MEKTILCVDDSESIREALSFSLRKAGYSTLTGKDGKEALELLNSAPVKLVITDLNMPNLNGIELTRKIRSDKSTQYLPILILTTESQVDMKMQAKQAGATGWIVKPFVEDSLLRTIKKVIR